jgi:small GTP-binding protein
MPRTVGVLKILLIGESGAGKTSMLLRYTDDEFRSFSSPTVAVDYRSKTIVVDGVSVQLNIWDTGGQERFGAIVRSYYRGANGVFVCFDMNDRASFVHAENWFSGVRDNDPDVPIVLVGNKCDLPAEVDMDEIRAFAGATGMNFIAVSAKTGEGIDSAFLLLVEEALKRVEEAVIRVTMTGEESPQRRRRKCCR